jgi:signal transduction histidine kinase/CheY-like chemotaxis protein
MRKLSPETLAIVLLSILFLVATVIEFNTYSSDFDFPSLATIEGDTGLTARQAASLRKDLQLRIVNYNAKRNFYVNVGLYLVIAFGILIFFLFGVQLRLRRAAREVSRARDQALEAAEIKSEFVANISHELRTPMTAVIGMTDLLMTTELTDEQREYAKIIHSSAEALLTLINDILDFSKVEAGKINIENIEFDLPSLVSKTSEPLSVEALARGLSFETIIDNKVPALVRGDPVRVRQVLLNLAGNGVKFTKSGGVKVKLDCVAEAEESVSVRFSVSDTGIGLPPDSERKLFQPFMQADGSITRKYGGTGLGLSISKRLVEVMGGEIGYSSMPGQGSCFWFTVPFQRASTAKVPACEVAELPVVVPVSAKPEPAERPGILVAEDNATNRKVVGLLLKSLGYSAEYVSNGKDALEAIERSDYSLLLLDCQMPEMDGFETARRIRARERGKSTRSPIVALTAHALPADKQRCLAAGMDDFLCKPVNTSQLSQTLSIWLKPTSEMTLSN